MKIALTIVIGLLLWNNDDVRSFTAENLYHVADFIEPETTTERLLDQLLN